MLMLITIIQILIMVIIDRICLHWVKLSCNLVITIQIIEITIIIQ
jgi:hypothetical protein